MQICCSLSLLAECACRGSTCTTDLRVSLQQSALGGKAVPCNFSTQYSLLKLLCGTVRACTNSNTAVWLRHWFDAIITVLLLRELFRFYNVCDISVVKHISSCNYSSHYITSKSRIVLKKIICCIMKKKVIWKITSYSRQHNYSNNKIIYQHSWWEEITDSPFQPNSV